MAYSGFSFLQRFDYSSPLRNYNHCNYSSALSLDLSVDVIQSGHVNRILDMKLDTSGQFLLSGSTSGCIVLHDVTLRANKVNKYDSKEEFTKKSQSKPMPRVITPLRKGLLKDSITMLQENAEKNLLKKRKSEDMKHYNSVTGSNINADNAPLLFKHNSAQSYSFTKLQSSSRIVRQNSNDKFESCNSLCWYPFDSGMFFTGSNSISVWDTSQMCNVSAYNVGTIIKELSMSKISSHSLVAMACGGAKLFDIRVGCPTHTLSKNGAQSICWSTKSEFEIYTCENAMVCLWDIRKSGNTKFFAGKFPADVSKLSVLNDSLVICSESYGKLEFWDLQNNCRIDNFVSFPFFIPSKCDIHLYFLDNKPTRVLKAHYEFVQNVCWNAKLNELYSSSGNSILLWDILRKNSFEDLSDWSSDEKEN